MAYWRNSSSKGETYYIPCEHLRVGAYVFVDLPWLSHPFVMNGFRISSEEQIAVLQSLGLRQFRYDPLRSEIEPLRTGTARPLEELAPGGDDTDQPHGKSSFRDKCERNRALIEYRIRFGMIEKAFLKTTKTLRDFNRYFSDRPIQALTEAESIVDQLVIAFTTDSEITLHIMSEKLSDVESYSHALNVTVLSMMLSRALNLTSEQVRDVGLGALLHDMGKAEVPDRVLRKKPEERTTPERELLAMHCQIGVGMGKKLGVSRGVLGVILQHHEMADGTGYPRGLTLDAIPLASRVVALVNYYDNLCNPADPAQAMTPHEALSLMFGQRRNKFDVAVLQQMIRCLGVYPPGTIVTLSNGATGLVVAVSPSRPLRPVVMVYEADMPKEQAILIDLDVDKDISIVRADHPRLLPPKVLAYLSPRRRVSYYFESSAQTDQVMA